MPKKLQLSESFISKLSELPETGMGYQKVTVELKTGKILTQRTVVNSEFLILEENEEFSSEDISSIELE